LLLLGTRRSAFVSAALVALKIAALGLFVWAALPAFDLANLTPFNPYGFTKAAGADGAERGIMAAAAIIFSAFYGFDAVASAAEETRNPRRDLAIGILGSMLACILIYIVIAVAALGALPFARFANSPEPLALILRELGQSDAARFLAISAVIALPTVILAFFYGQTRVVFAMARDGLLPRRLAKVSRAGVPVRTTLVTTLVVSMIAALLPLGDIVALANAGTLLAFSTVALGMLVRRRRAPLALRGYRAPAAWLVGPVAIAGCFYLFARLPSATHIWFLGWNSAVVLGYFFVRRRGRR
jgi:APA family basic amino acid/polyamine antiporter